MYAAFDQYGRARGFYPDDVYEDQEDGSRHAKIPEDAVEISLDEWQMYLSNQPYSAFRNGAVVVLEVPVPGVLIEPLPPTPNPIETALNEILSRLADLEKKVKDR